MASFLSDTGSLEFRAVLQRAASSGPFARDRAICTTRAERLSFVAECVDRTILPRRIEFFASGRRILCIVARDGRLMGLSDMREPSHAGEDGLDACSPENLADICDTIDAALETAEELSFTAAAFDASTDMRGVGVPAAELYAEAESSPLPLSAIEALERLVAHASQDLLAVYYDQNSQAETKVSDEVPEEVATWVAHRVLLADTSPAAALSDDLPLLVHPQGYCLALVGQIAEPIALLFDVGSIETLAEEWSRLRSTPRKTDP